MLYIGLQVHNGLYIILAGVMEFSPDINYKNSSLTQAFLQEEFKFSPSRRHQRFGFNLALMLLPLIYGSLLEKSSGK